MNLGKLIKSYMDQQGKTVRDMAQDVGCKPTTLFRLIKGKPIHPSQVHIIYTWLTDTTKP